MNLPRLPAQVRKSAAEMVEMRGINWSANTQDGDMADSVGVSARRWPYIATRKAREQQTAYSGVTALTAWDKLVAVEGTNLLYDGQVVGTVTAGEKQFAVVNTKLVIWPDKVYLDLTARTVTPLGASVTATGATFTAGSETASATVQLAGVSDLRGVFKAGDGVKLSGSATEANNKVFVIKTVTADTLTATTANAFTAATESRSITVAREVPDLEYICESENRLWGCNSEKQTIYASALGDPQNFNVFEGLSTDSFAVAVGSQGVFTGCCKLSSSILFWKENTLHKVLGSYPAEYSMYTYTVEGLREGCHKSLAVINETLFYMGLHGVFAYSGGTPSLISANFGEREFTKANAGSDGDSYYISCKDTSDTWHLMIYETRADVWVHEDNIECTDFARMGRDLYFSKADGTVWRAATAEDDPNLAWFVRFTPFYETTQGRKRYTKLHLRVELPKGSWLRIHASVDGGRWTQLYEVTGRDYDVVTLPVPITRGDKYELKIDGKGPCSILSIARMFYVGSDA